MKIVTGSNFILTNHMTRSRSWIFYDRVLLGFVVGIAYGLKIHPLIRGAIIGAVVSLLIAIPSGITGGALLMGAGVVYGMVTDLVATKFSPGLNRISVD